MPKHGPVSMKNRFLPTILLTVLLVFVPVIGGIGFGMAVAGGTSNGQYQNTAGSSIDHTYNAAFGWDPTSGQYVIGTMAKGTGNVTISFPAGDKISYVWVFTNNPKYDANALLSNASIYTNVNVALTTASKSNLSNVIMYMGQIVNSSVATSPADKGVANFLVQTPIYSSTVNNLGDAIEMPVLQLLGSVPSATGVVYIGLSTAGNFANTSQVSLVLTQTFGHTQQYNIITGTEAITVVLAILEIVFLYFAVPRHKEWEE